MVKEKQCFHTYKNCELGTLSCTEYFYWKHCPNDCDVPYVKTTQGILITGRRIRIYNISEIRVVGISSGRVRKRDVYSIKLLHPYIIRVTSFAACNFIFALVPSFQPRLLSSPFCVLCLQWHHSRCATLILIELSCGTICMYKTLN